MSFPVVPPRLRPLSQRRSATFAVLDVGTSKIACLIARLTPARDVAPGDWRTHRMRVIGVGHQRSLGVKNGLVVDMDEAERAIRQTVEAAESMYGAQIDHVVVTASGGRLSSEHFTAGSVIGGREVAEHKLVVRELRVDQRLKVARVLHAVRQRAAHEDHVVLRAKLQRRAQAARGGQRKEDGGRDGRETKCCSHVSVCDAWCRSGCSSQGWKSG